MFRLIDCYAGGQKVIDSIDSCHDPVDEVLEVIWTLKEDGEAATAEQLTTLNLQCSIDEHLLEGMRSDGLLEKKSGEYVFTEVGRIRAEAITRRHRLAERLLVDVLNMQEMSIESEACTFEHFLSPEVTDHICILLGHPKKCPHGKLIPPGPCCAKAEKRVETAVFRLSELRAGEEGRIVYISTQSHQRLDRLTSLGLFPGRVVHVHQREPVFVILLDETQLAVERGIVEEIYVIRS